MIEVWGLRRYILFFAGILLLTVSALYREDNFIGKTIHSNEGKLKLYAIVLNIAIFLIYFWYISTGTVQMPSSETNYYDLLATAFHHVSLH
ncbi:MAG: hypothetical protein HC797_09740 [Anaerolineales bacterium]|nr:hypothetical protein [Anaerolineales bacterium]